MVFWGFLLMVVSAVEPKRSKSQLKRDQIIESATKLFIEQGYPNTSMDKVAKEICQLSHKRYAK